MTDRALAIICFALAAACAAFIRHDDTSMFYQILFLGFGVYQLVAPVFRKWASTDSPARDMDGSGA